MCSAGLQGLGAHGKTLPTGAPGCSVKWASGTEEGKGDFPASGDQQRESPRHPSAAGDGEDTAACLCEVLRGSCGQGALQKAGRDAL